MRARGGRYAARIGVLSNASRTLREEQGSVNVEIIGVCL
jgi:hypothetical protein